MVVLLAQALKTLLDTPEALKETTAMLQRGDTSADAFMMADAAVSTITQAIATRQAQASPAAAPVKRRQ